MTTNIFPTLSDRLILLPEHILQDVSLHMETNGKQIEGWCQLLANVSRKQDEGEGEKAISGLVPLPDDELHLSAMEPASAVNQRPEEEVVSNATGPNDVIDIAHGAPALSASSHEEVRWDNSRAFKPISYVSRP